MALIATLSTSRTKRSLIGEWWRSVDHITLGFLICLIGAGLILGMAASPAASARLGLDNPFYFLFRQGLCVTIGLIGAFILSLMAPSNARRVGILALLGSAGLMVLLPYICIVLLSMVMIIIFRLKSVNPQITPEYFF